MKSALNSEIVQGALHVCERAALEAAKWRGLGDNTAADKAAVDAMRSALMQLDIEGTVVIGEGERDEAPMLYIGESVGTGKGPAIDIALDPLEGTNLCAASAANALTVMAVAPHGSLLNAPDLYMDKLAVGAAVGEGVVSLDNDVATNIAAVAKALHCPVSSLQVCVLDRKRHLPLIDKIRGCGARVQLITDGDISAAMVTADTKSGIHLYMGTGGAPEGVLAAAALKVTGGDFQARLLCRNEQEKERAQKLGIKNFDKTYCIKNMVRDDVLFVASGVTDGTLLDGVRFEADCVSIHSLTMHFATRRIQTVRARLPID